MDDTTARNIERLASGDETPLRAEAIIADVLASTMKLCTAIAGRHCRYTGLDWNNDSDDLIQLVLEAEVKMLRMVYAQDPRAADWPTYWEARLHHEARSAIRGFADGVGNTGISGYTGAVRRQRSMNGFARKYEAEIGRTASPEEIVAAWNENVLVTRSRPRKQSAFATEADLTTPIRVHPQSPDMIAETSGAPKHDSALLDQLEATDIIASVVSTCMAKDTRLGQVAKAWLDWYPHGTERTPTSVARELGISIPKTKRDIAKVREIFRDIVRQTF